MSYLVLARKWRPRNFEEILGQDAIVRTVKNAISQNRVSHAFLFTGPRGVGKTSLARVLAKALNCQNQDGPTTNPCGTCSACTDITNDNAVDVLEIDGASNRGIENIRELRETVRYPPASFRTKIYIIDEVHMLTKEAFNALLKTLEEPPPHIVFIFATTEPKKVLPTILSRCQRYDFHRVSMDVLVDHLSRICREEGIDLSEDNLRVIAREAEGSVRDSLSLLDQLVSFGTGELTEEEVLRILGVVDRTLIFSIIEAILNNDPASALDAVETADESGYDIKQLARELLMMFRNLLVVRLTRNPQRIMDLTENELERINALAGDRHLETLERLFDHLARLDENLNRSSQPRILLETTLVKMAITPEVAPLAELIARLEELERGVAAGRAKGSPPDTSENSAPLFQDPQGKEARQEPDDPTDQQSAEPDWKDFLAFLENRDHKLFAMLSRGVFEGKSGKELRLAFPPGQWVVEQLKNKENAGKLQNLVAQCYGDGHHLIITENESLAKTSARKSSPIEEESKLRKQAMEDPVVRTLLDKLGGEIEEIKIK
ncbi:MAG: DNA polymerase III subunit gamma/tau [bacterium]